jgi:hypothetical protein
MIQVMDYYFDFVFYLVVSLRLPPKTTNPYTSISIAMYLQIQLHISKPSVPDLYESIPLKEKMNRSLKRYE